MQLIRPTPAPLLRRQRVSVSDVGEMVKLEIGNYSIDFPYETALQLSAWLRVHAKRAKMRAGDTSRRWNVVGILEDGSK